MKHRDALVIAAAGELEVKGTVERFVAGFPFDDVELLRFWVAIPNSPAAQQHTLPLQMEYGPGTVAKVSSRVEGLRLALGVSYDVVVAALRRELKVDELT